MLHHLIYLALPVLALTLLVQLILKTTYAKYSRQRNRLGITGAEAARRILRASGLGGVRVEEVSGFLSDHYDPRNRILRLSPANYNGVSIAAVGVAAHEAGHAVQHAERYAPLALRSAAVPAASIGSSMGYLVLLLGVFTHSMPVGILGLILIGAVVLFQLITLPVEFDASRRALALLPETGILSADEVGGARKVLGAAALTYVAATAAAIAELLYWAWRLGLLGGRSSSN